ncbi:hypothetical protein K439DRAFT_332815 [Ramaria rubella]|nr:hypothetical protein K439DRAFT_332815 [Ramaria rubella]
MGRSRIQVKSRIVGYNANTGSPIRLRRRNKVVGRGIVEEIDVPDIEGKAFICLPKQPQQRRKNENQRNTVLCAGGEYPLPPQHTIANNQSPLHEIDVHGSIDVNTSEHCIPATNECINAENEDEDTSTLNRSSTGFWENHTQHWDATRPQKSVRRDKRAVHWPRWRTYILP